MLCYGTAPTRTHKFRIRTMRAEIQSLADEIKEALALLRRHL